MKTFQFDNLTDEVKLHMIEEIKSDIESKKLAISDRISPEGAKVYPELLLEAAKKGDRTILSEGIKELLNPTEFNRGKQKKLPLHAEKTIAQNEFNRFYMRAVCMEAMKQEIENVEVYRAGKSKHPRKRSEALAGRTISPYVLLTDLRKNVDTDPKLFPSINSGLSIKF